MHLYLRLVNESGDPIGEQAFEAGFHSEEVGVYRYGVSKASDNFNTVGKP